MAHAASLLDEGRVSEAREVLEELDSDRARVMLARLIVFTDPEKALDLVSSIEADEPAVRSIVEAVREVAGRLTSDAAELPPGPGRNVFQSVLEHLKAGKLDAAALDLISLLQSDRFYDDDAARKLGIALFTILGSDDPVTRKHRRTFDMYLY